MVIFSVVFSYFFPEHNYHLKEYSNLVIDLQNRTEITSPNVLENLSMRPFFGGRMRSDADSHRSESEPTNRTDPKPKSLGLTHYY